MKKILYLIRHGQTDWNKLDSIQGNQDIPLNEVGLQQAEETAEILKDVHIEHVYTSKLMRAYQTGSIIAKSQGVGCDKINGLQEISFGDYEGRTKAQLKEEFGEDFYHKLFHSQEMQDFAFKNGESKKQCKIRFSKAILKLLNSVPYSTIAVVAHGFVINTFLSVINFNDIVVRGVKNCEVIYLEYEDGKFSNIKIINKKIS